METVPPVEPGRGLVLVEDLLDPGILLGPLRAIHLGPPLGEQAVDLGVGIAAEVPALARGPDVGGGVGIGPGAPAAEGCVELLLEQLLLEHGELRRPHVHPHPDPLEALLQERGDLLGHRLLATEHGELEGHAPPVDLAVPDPVVVAVDPAGLVEQRLGPVEILAVGFERLLRGHPGGRMEDAGAGRVEAMAGGLEHPLVVEGVAHRPADAAVGEERALRVPAEMKGDPLWRRGLRVLCVVPVIAGLGRPLLREQRHLLDLPFFKRQQCRVGILQDPKPDLVEEGLGTDLFVADGVPRSAGPQENLLAADSLHDLIRAAADRLGLERDMPSAVLERGIVFPGLAVDVPGDDREVDVPDVGRQRLPVEVDERVVIVGVDAAELVGAAADRRHRHPLVHDDLVAKGHVMGGDRLAVAPEQVVAEHHLVERAVDTRLPLCNGLSRSEGLEVAVEGEQAKPRQTEHIALG